MSGGRGASFRTLAVQLSVVAAAACGGGSPAAPTPASSAPATLDGALASWAREPGHVGVSAAVLRPDGSLWTGAAGLARTGEALRPEHEIAVGSITKTVTAALILQLAREGRLGLEDPVGAWLGTIRNVPPEVSLRQLLNHTGGLANYTRHPDYAAAIAADPGRRFTPPELLERFLLPPVFEAGARTEYTNTGFLLLGLVAEAAGGRPIAEQWRERFWRPLGLGEVFLPPDEPPGGSVAHAWIGSSQAAGRETDPLANVASFSSYWAAFGLMASPRDVARWGRALFAGSVLDAATRAEMLEFVPPGDVLSVETGSGLGVRRYQYGGREQWGHSGAAPEGSSIFFYEPSSGFTVALAMNQSPATHASSHFALAGELLRLASGR